MVIGNCPHPYVHPLYTGCLCRYSDGREQRDSHCHVSCWGAVTILTMQRPRHHFWAVISNTSLESPAVVEIAVFVNVLFRFMFSHACLYEKMLCFIDWGDTIYSAPRNANLSNIGCQNEIILVLNGSVTKRIVSRCDGLENDVIWAHYICNIVSVQAVHLILILDVLTQSKSWTYIILCLLRNIAVDRYCSCTFISCNGYSAHL